MSRLASLHIKEDDLAKVIEEVLEILSDEPMDETFPTLLARHLVIRGYKYTCNTRKLLVNDAITAQKVKKLVLNPKENTLAFVNALKMARKQAHHRGIKDIQPGSSDWLKAKEITSLVDEFCNEYDLDKKKGYFTYCKIAVKILKGYALNKIPSIHEKVYTLYEAERIVNSDVTPGETRRGYNLYQQLAAEATSIVEAFITKPERYQYFVLAKQSANQYGVDIEDYINSQFEGLEWTGNIPTPEQLVGEKSISRLKGYMSKTGKRAKTKETPKVNWKLLKKKK